MASSSQNVIFYLCQAPVIAAVGNCHCEKHREQSHTCLLSAKLATNFVWLVSMYLTACDSQLQAEMAPAVRREPTAI